MSAILTTAPACFAHPALFGTAGAANVEYLAVGTPELSQTFPDTKPPNWAKLARLGALAALEISEDTYVEVRAFRGAYFDDFSRHSGERTSWSAGAFLFPARKPFVLGAFKCFRQFDWHGDTPNVRRNALSIASIGHRGLPVSFNSERGTGTLPLAARAAFASCLTMLKAYNHDDELSRALGTIMGTDMRSTYGAMALFHRIFGSGSEPQFGTRIQFFIPENITSRYDKALPLVRPEDLSKQVTYIGYNLQRSRFVDLNSQRRVK